MPRDREHLSLITWNEPLLKRKKGGGPGFKQSNKQEHGLRLIRQSEELIHDLGNRRTTAPQGINPKLAF